MSGCRIALFADSCWRGASSTGDHIKAFARYSRNHVVLIDPRRWVRGDGFDLTGFDVVAIHYSIRPEDPNYLPPPLFDAVARFPGRKVQYRQDEYRNVDLAVKTMQALGIDTLFTVIPMPDARRVYHHRAFDRINLIPTWTGYVSPAMERACPPSLATRPLDLGYRARENPYWLGDLAREKIWIAEGVAARAKEFGLRCDVSSRFEDRIYGRRWRRFVESCRGFLGTESGASVVDFDGTLEAATESFLLAHPGAPYEEVKQASFAPADGRVVIHTFGPRVFECAALGTAMVQFPGDHGGIIEPWRHYIPLARDFSNLAEVVSILRDTAALRAMTERARSDLIASGAFALRRMAEDFDAAIRDAGQARRTVPVVWTTWQRGRFSAGAMTWRGLEWMAHAGRRMRRLAWLGGLVMAVSGPRRAWMITRRSGVQGLAEFGRLLLLVGGTPWQSDRKRQMSVTAGLKAGRLTFQPSGTSSSGVSANEIGEWIANGAVREIAWEARTDDPLPWLLEERSYRFLVMERLLRTDPRLLTWNEGAAHTSAR